MFQRPTSSLYLKRYHQLFLFFLQVQVILQCAPGNGRTACWPTSPMIPHYSMLLKVMVRPKTAYHMLPKAFPVWVVTLLKKTTDINVHFFKLDICVKKCSEVSDSEFLLRPNNSGHFLLILLLTN